MPSQSVDRAKLRRASWRMLEPDLTSFWEDYRIRSGYDSLDAIGKAFALTGAREVIDLVVEYRRNQVDELPEPSRTHAIQVLQECAVLIEEFFGRLRSAVAS